MSDRNIRLLLLTGRADVGGGPRHVDLLIHHLPDDFDLWLAAPSEPPFGPQWRALSRLRGVMTLPARRFSPTALVRLALLARAERIDVAYSHGTSAGLYARLLKLLAPQVKVVHALHGLHAGQYAPFNRAAYVAVERALRLLTHRFVHVSSGERDAAVEAGVSAPSRAVVIPNGIGAVEPPNPDTFSHLGQPVIAMLTRFEYQKNMDLALDIARRAQEQHQPWRFAWAGDGADRARIQTKARAMHLNNLVILGAVSRPIDLLGRAAVLLNTSRWEGLPYALLEAGALGVPTVATRVVGNDDVIEDDVNGYLFEPGDPDAAVQALARILESRALAQRLAEGARCLVASRFSLERSINSAAFLLRTAARTA